MDISELKYLGAVARLGSFSAAAAALGITQPGLTKAIRRLEAEFGCRLFIRLPRGVAPTTQGRALIRHAGLIEVQLQDAEEEVRSLGRGAVGVLRIGAGPSWLSRALPRVVAQLAVEYPDLSFRVVGGFNAALMEGLRSGDLDVVVSALPDENHAGLRCVPLSTDRLSVVARLDHPLQRRRRVVPADTRAHAWALPGRDVLSRSRLDALFRVAGLEPPEACIESDSFSFIAAVLRDSDMLSFATSQILATEVGIAPLAVSGLTMTRSAGVILRASAGTTATTAALVTALEQLAAEMDAN